MGKNHATLKKSAKRKYFEFLKLRKIQPIPDEPAPLLAASRLSPGTAGPPGGCWTPWFAPATKNIVKIFCLSQF